MATWEGANTLVNALRRRKTFQNARRTLQDDSSTSNTPQDAPMTLQVVFCTLQDASRRSEDAPVRFKQSQDDPDETAW